MIELKRSKDSENDEQDELDVDGFTEKSWIVKTGSFIFEIIKTVIISLAIILPIRYFVIQPFYVKGASMEPNFYEKDYLIINEFLYRFKKPERGDIIVFKNPKNQTEYFIKRIIGLPFEKVKIYDKNVYIYNEENPEGVIIGEDYLNEEAVTNGNDIVELDEFEYYVLGDNRSKSLDSRVFGPVKESLMIGKVWVRGWPLERMSYFGEEDYNL